MEHAAFANVSDLHLVLTRLVYEDRQGLPLSWRRALGFRRLVSAALEGSPARPAPPLAPTASGKRAGAPPAERREPASCGGALRRPKPTPSAGSVDAATALRRERAVVRETGGAIAYAARAGIALCTLDLSHEGFGRVQIFLHRRGERIDCAVLCARNARPLVERALVLARHALVRSGLHLVAPCDGPEAA